MVTKTGKNLTVLIVSRIAADWQTYATWYSVLKNLPEAEVQLAVMKTGETPFQMFQWAKRLELKMVWMKPFSEDHTANVLDAIRTTGFVGQKLLLLEPGSMVLDTLTPEMVSTLSEGVPEIDAELDKLFLEDGKALSEVHPIFDLHREAKDMKEVWPIVSTDKGCGRWIHTMKGCPFSSAAGMMGEDMTVNEHRVIELWQRMTSLYGAVS